MLELAVLLAFVSGLCICLSTGASILWALAAGYVIFCGYGWIRGYRIRQLLRMSFDGVKTVRNILMLFALIGFITALWRAAGTIPVIVCWASGLIRPSAFLLITFLLNCLVSVLTGTSFGTGATMGVICMAMANAMGVSPFYTGGAILSGIYFGDRCSPVSSSANLVCVLTGTDIFDNLGGMIRTSLIPLALSCAVYYAIGQALPASGQAMEVETLFVGSFRLHAAAVLPAAAILLLSACKVNVKKTMAVSIGLAVVLCIFLQSFSLAQVVKMAIFGYQAPTPELAEMMNGGGLVSMIRVAIIVSLSSSYAGIFEGTGLLNSIRSRIAALSRRITVFGGVLVVSVITSMIACNQTLAIMLTHQLCRDTEPDARQFALDLENTAVVISPLIPWSIAGAVPLAAVGAPVSSMMVACYLYFLPLCQLAVRVWTEKRKRSGNEMQNRK